MIAKIKRNQLLQLFFGFTFLFLYAPIVLLVLFSWNANPFTQAWHGFTMHWYSDLWNSQEIWDAFGNSCMIAFKSTVSSVMLGTLFVAFSSKYYKDTLQFLFYISLAVPEILIAVGLLRFFDICSIPLSASTIWVGHTLLGLGYVVPILCTRYEDIDQRLVVAARDLGATHWQVFYTVLLPLLLPAILASSLLVFIISLDDFFISFFCADAGTQTLPLYIFSVIRAGATPTINALSVLLFVFTSCSIFIFSALQFKSSRVHSDE